MLQPSIQPHSDNAGFYYWHRIFHFISSNFYCFSNTQKAKVLSLSRVILPVLDDEIMFLLYNRSDL